FLYYQDEVAVRMTRSVRFTSGIAALGHRSIKGDLFVLKALRHGSRSLLLRAKGAASLRTEPDNNSPMRRPLLLQTKAQCRYSQLLCLWACWSSCVCRARCPVCLSSETRGIGPVR